MSRDVAPPPTELQFAEDGVGPLLQRDYWAVIKNVRCRPSEVAQKVRLQFADLPAAEVVSFERPAGASGELGVGEELDIQIRLAGEAQVRVMHTCPCSVTFATLKGHPEAGRITFGAYRNTDGEVIFQIRSRARASSRLNYLGFLIGGDPMQTTSWTTFIDNVARTCGDGVDGEVRAETKEIGANDWQPGDRTLDEPTFIAEAD